MRWNRMSTALILAPVVWAMLIGQGGCRVSSEDDSLTAPASPVISRRADWAMADELYVSLYEEPRMGARILAHMRGGDIGEIRERTVFRETQHGLRDHWYRLEFGEVEGWVHGARIQRFELVRQAENAAERGRDD